MNIVLKLNADFTPLAVILWSSAIELTMCGKAITVEIVPDKFVRSEHLAVPWPSVVALKRYKTVRGRAKFSGKSVIARDFGRCGYCGIMPRTADGRIDRRDLTLDHVVPRAQAQHGTVYLPWSKKWVNVTSWENAITACRACNNAKADRTPAEAGMKLQCLPRVPTHADVLRISLTAFRNIPDAWRAYLPGVT